MKLEGKNSLVTGGDQGIGQAVALKLAEVGADVAAAQQAGYITGATIVLDGGLLWSYSEQ